MSELILDVERTVTTAVRDLTNICRAMYPDDPELAEHVARLVKRVREERNAFVREATGVAA